MRPILFACLLSAVAVSAPAPARGAESYDSCAGTITTLPAVITTQGVWCLKGDLSTAMTSGVAILISANNVTLDCNGFKVGGLAGGPDTQAYGVYVDGRLNATVRGCTVRGFHTGMVFSGTGHIVEDNRLEGMRATGLLSVTDGGIVRRNLIVDTGGSVSAPRAIDFADDHEITDNTIIGVFPRDLAPTAAVWGIYSATGSQSRIRGNTIRGLTTLDRTGVISGIRISSLESEVSGNFLAAVPSADSAATAVFCGGGTGFVRDNLATGFDVMTQNCPAEGTGNQLR